MAACWAELTAGNISTRLSDVSENTVSDISLPKILQLPAPLLSIVIELNQ